MQIDLNQRYQTMLILWFALLMSIALYFVYLQFAPLPANDPGDPRNSSLIVGFTALGTVVVIASFLVKRKLLKRSIDKQDPLLVQKAMIVALAMCEVCALLGVIERLVIGYREYYLLLILAAVADVFHMPRRSQLEAASYKNTKLWN
jgi:hypothetical protein